MVGGAGGVGEAGDSVEGVIGGGAGVPVCIGDADQVAVRVVCESRGRPGGVGGRGDPAGGGVHALFGDVAGGVRRGGELSVAVVGAVCYSSVWIGSGEQVPGRVVGVGGDRSSGVGDGERLVEVVVGVGGGVAVGVRLCEDVAVCVVGLAGGVAERVGGYELAA